MRCLKSKDGFVFSQKGPQAGSRWADKDPKINKLILTQIPSCAIGAAI